VGRRATAPARSFFGGDLHAISTDDPQPSGAFANRLSAKAYRCFPQPQRRAFHSRHGSFRQPIHRLFPPLLAGSTRIVPMRTDARGGTWLRSGLRRCCVHPRFTARPRWFSPIGQMEPHIKVPRLRTGRAENSENNRGKFSMKRITAAVALMCALSAYVSYPSATVSGGAAPSLALSMQESRSLPMEAYDAV